MAEIDSFASQLFEEAKRFLELATEADENGRDPGPFLHASTNLCFCALEAHLNSIAEDFLTREDLSPCERSLLSERQLELKEGVFVLSEHIKIYRLEDRILFLCRRFSRGVTIDRRSSYWSRFKEALRCETLLRTLSSRFLLIVRPSSAA